MNLLLTNWYKFCLAIYPTTFQLLSPIYLVIWVLISIHSSFVTFDYLLATICHLFSVSIVLLDAVINFLSTTISHLLLSLKALSTVAFNSLLAAISAIRLFCLYWTILQNLSANLKILWIIQFALDHLALFTYMELARFFTILFESVLKL